MGSRDRMPPNLRRPLPDTGMMWSHPFMREPPLPPPGPFFDMLPPPEIMEQNLAKQHMEMQKLAIENEKLATTHSLLRKELVAAQQDRQRLEAQVAAAKVEKEQQMRDLSENMAKMEADLQSFEPLKVELQKSRAEVEHLLVSRQELIAQVQQLNKDLERSHAEGKQIPVLLSELDAMRQEYQNCRITYDNEKKIYEDHIQSLQLMEKKYVSMSREIEKLRAELGRHSSSATYKANDAHTKQGHGLPQSNSSSYGGRPAGPTGAQMGPEVPKAPNHGNQNSMNYDSTRGPHFDSSGDQGYNHRSASYDANRAASLDASGYDASRGASGYDSRTGAGGYDGSKGPSGYDYGAIRSATGFNPHRSGPYNDPSAPAGAPGAGGGVLPRNAGGTGYQVPAGAEYDAPRGSGGGRLPTHAGSYGSMHTNFPAGAPYRGGNAQR